MSMRHALNKTIGLQLFDKIMVIKSWQMNDHFFTPTKLNFTFLYFFYSVLYFISSVLLFYFYFNCNLFEKTSTQKYSLFILLEKIIRIMKEREVMGWRKGAIDVFTYL